MFWSLKRCKSFFSSSVSILYFIGKESSGTTFVTKFLSEAIGVPGPPMGTTKGRTQKEVMLKFRDGVHPVASALHLNYLPSQVQHFSLPQGQFCAPNYRHKIIDTTLPSQCVVTYKMIEDMVVNHTTDDDSVPKDMVGTNEHNVSQPKHRHKRRKGWNRRYVWNPECVNLINTLRLEEKTLRVYPADFIYKRIKDFNCSSNFRYPGRSFEPTESTKHETMESDPGWHRHLLEDAKKINLHLLKDAKKKKLKKKVTDNSKTTKREEYWNLKKTKREEYRKERREKTKRRINDWVSAQSNITSNFLKAHNYIRYPERLFLNITAQKLWYDAMGTEQVVIIVVRDKEISALSRSRGHCHFKAVMEEEEKIATSLLNDAIRTFILEDKEGFRSGFGGKWYSNNIADIFEEDLLWNSTKYSKMSKEAMMAAMDEAKDDILYSSLIPAKNNVVLVSYELMMKYQMQYVNALYKILGIQNHFVPEFQDANAKYDQASQARSRP